MSIYAAYQSSARSARWWLVALGIVGILAGLLVVFRPFESAVVLAWILGLWLILRGIVGLLSAVSPVSTGSRLLLGLSGVLFIIAGILFIVNPGSAALGIAVPLGALALAWGVFHLISGISNRRQLKNHVHEP